MSLFVAASIIAWEIQYSLSEKRTRRLLRHSPAYERPAGEPR